MDAQTIIVADRGPGRFDGRHDAPGRLDLIGPREERGIAEHGVEELTTDYLESDDLPGLGWMLAAIAARVLDAEGAYRAPTPDGGTVYLVLRSLKFVS